MLTLLLLRHATHDLVGKVLAGRSAGLSLSPEGRSQAQALKRRLAGEPVQRIFASPLERCLETAAPLAAERACEVEVAEELNEIDCGAWTGARFEDLAGDPRWAFWNQRREAASTPGGESMAEVQARAMSLVHRLGAEDRTLAFVTHSDVIKAIVSAVLGLSLNRHDAFSIDPASITTLVLWATGGRVVRMNEAAGS